MIQRQSTAVDRENQLAVSMLEEAVSNPIIHEALSEISAVLLKAVITPTRAELKKVTKFEELAEPYQEILKDLAAEHSAEKRQYGAMMPSVESSSEVLGSLDHIEDLLVSHEYVLSKENIYNVKTIDDMAIILKTIVELGFTYYQEAPADLRSTIFDEIKKHVSPSSEESDIRVLRTDLGEEKQFALTFGIGTEQHDLGLANLKIGRNAGKSAFGKVDMAARLAQICAAYDETQSVQSKDKMTYYKIPLEKTERDEMHVYAARWETVFEKWVKSASLPFIASVSWATTRVLVSLQDLGAFNKPDGSFDFDKAQIIANCLQGFIVHAGHHSTVEVAEVYNRLLDYVAIKHLEEKENKPVVNVTESELVEKKLPYYRYDSYRTFFHSSYAEKISPEKQIFTP